MSFEQDMARFNRKVRQRFDGIYRGVTNEVFTSVVEGSAITGAPGQPVRSARLKRSWKKLTIGRLKSAIVTDVPYAQIIEDNLRGATLRSKVGGFHSVKMTRAGYLSIVRHVNRRLKYAGQYTDPGSTGVTFRGQL